MTFVYILVAILILMFMITIHELGHYIAGKILKFKINEFSIGFGPAMFKRTNKKTGEVFAIRWIPLGGYCAFAGDDADSFDGKTEVNNNVSRADIPFSKMPPWKRLIVLFSGAFANFICAIVFSIILLTVVGYSHTVQINSMRNDSPNTNLYAGDVITEVNGNKFTLLNSYSSQMADKKLGDEVVFTVVSGGVTRYETVAIGKMFNNSGEIHGIGYGEVYFKYNPMSFWKAIGKGVAFSFELAWMMLSILGMMVTGKVSLSGMGGPFSTISIMSQSVSMSMLNILILIPLISINLAVFNLLPIPALDGARMVFVTIEWIRRKPINPHIENRIHMWGLFILLGFVLILDFNYLIFSRVILYNKMLC